MSAYNVKDPPLTDYRSLPLGHYAAVVFSVAFSVFSLDAIARVEYKGIPA
jgi:hypothetical protein